MSRDLTFKEHMELEKLGMPPFGTFCAKFDKKEIIVGEETITNKDDKIKLINTIIDFQISEPSIHYKDASNKDAVKFLLDYIDEMDLYDDIKWQDIKNKLEKLKNEDITAQETFKKAQEIILEKEIDLER